MRNAVPALVLFLLFFRSLVPGVVLGQDARSSLVGTVTADDSDDPVVGAIVEMLGTRRSARTDQSGRFQLHDLPGGTLVLTIRRLGFKPVEVEVDLFENEDLVIEPGVIVLDPVPVELSPVAVEGEPSEWIPHLQRSGFYDRRVRERGIFVDREQMDKWNPQVFTDVLRRVPGVRVRPNPGYGHRPSRFEPRDTRRNIVELSRNPTVGCNPLLFMDGIFLGNLSTVDADTQIAHKELAGVEVYRGASEVPPQFRLRGSSCGVIVLWTN